QGIVENTLLGVNTITAAITDRGEDSIANTNVFAAAIAAQFGECVWMIKAIMVSVGFSRRRFSSAHFEILVPVT
ncbi:MAG TPA: hypothetical protein VFK30_12565, partial [Anaerolineae bacterium]|nr:hypothetical protein [Anaerolineae bacterium]